MSPTPSTKPTISPSMKPTISQGNLKQPRDGGKEESVISSLKAKASDVASDPKTQVTAASAAGGAAILGTGGGAIGLGVGGSIGAACGILPAIFTFGFSIPIGALIGSTIGLCTGVAMGGATGLVGGGAIGYGAYTNRKEIKQNALTARGKVEKTVSKASDAFLSYVPESVKARALTGKAFLTAKVGVVKAELLAIRKQGVYSYAKVALRNAASYIETKASALKTSAVRTATDRKFQVTAASGTGGAIALGTAGGAAGMLAGGAIGGACGLLPAIFTFGLSIPVFAFVGGGVGMCAGVAVGSATGGVGGSAAGYGVYTKREEISKAAKTATGFAKEKLTLSRKYVLARLTSASDFVKAKATATKNKAAELKSGAAGAAADRKVQVTAASAAGGAVTLGSSGAAVGLVAGGAMGAAIGFVPAIFTFGLSIPFGAAIGGAAGFCTGAAVGGTTGLVGGGALGCGAYSKRDEISNGMDYVKDKASQSTDFVKEQAHNVKVLLVGGTGGTE